MELWVKALHVVAVISWMAGLLYLPRLYVYHCDVEIGGRQSETFKIMESRLLRVIMGPAMLVAWGSGLSLAFLQSQLADHWFWAKLVLVAAMTVFHMRLAAWRRDFAADVNMRSPKFYRLANELPTLLMIAIVVLVIVKPF